MQTKIWLSSPHLSGNEMNYIQDAFDKNWITSIGEKNCAIICITITEIALKRFKEEFPFISVGCPPFIASLSTFLTDTAMGEVLVKIKPLSL